MTELERVKARRRAHRSVVTRLNNEATPILEGERPERHLTRLRTIDGQLEDKKTTLTALDDEILSQIEVGEIETDVVDSEAIAYKIAQMRGEIWEVLERADVASRDEHVTEILSTAGSHERTSPPSSPALSERIEESIRSPLPSPEHVSDTNMESRSRIKPKLLKLQQPKFSGDITKFRTFWDSFI